VIQALVQHGADINAKDIDGNTPCHFCSEYGHKLCLKFLLTRYPYLFANNNEDKSAIDVAISEEILTEFQEFIHQSKDLNTQKKKTDVPQRVAATQKKITKMGAATPNPNDKTSGADSQPDSHGQSSGSNSISDGRINSARNTNNNSRLSNNTRMINKVTAVKNKIQANGGTDKN